MDVWDFSIIWLLLVVLQYTLGCMCPFESAFLYPLDKYLVLQLPGHRVVLFLITESLSKKLKKTQKNGKKIIPFDCQYAINCITRYLSKGYKNADSKGHIHPNVYSSAIDNIQIMERTQMSIN